MAKISRREVDFEIQFPILDVKINLIFNSRIVVSSFEPYTIKKLEIMKKAKSDKSNPLPDLIGGDYLADYNTLNRTEIPYPNVTLIELLRQQAASTPNNIAIEFNGVETTYEDLYKKANQLAYYLKEQGVQSGDFIGVSLLRSTELVATLIAILECGAAYVPLDPNYPHQRLEFMLQDSEAKFLIINKATDVTLSNSIKILFLEEALSVLPKLPNTSLGITANHNSIAYLLYTSGSTGKPKGVPITNKSLVNLLLSMAREPGIKETDKQLAVTTISFDIANVELFSPLLNGATIVMVDSETARDGRLLIELLRSKKITILQATPTTWKMLLETNWEEKLKLKACCGGEALTKELAQKLLSKCDSLWNMYGPTEVTIVSTVKEITPEDDIISIGKPIANYQIYILNANGELVPPGVVGEIAIAGHGVAKGYLKRENLTKEKFIKNKYSSLSSNETMYLSGDLGKLLPTGDILCLGRLDHQVKIRGYRIELGEIEETLASMDAIKSAVVIGHNDSLIAFVLLENDEEVDSAKIKEWKNYLANHLPEYFVPHNIKILKELPTTPNGKLDRNALLNSDSLKTSSNNSYTEPRTNEEKLVTSIWKETLGLDKIDIFSDFFEMGGHSIKAVKVMIEIEKLTGKRFPLSVLFEYSTVEKFAKLLNTGSEIQSDCLVPIKSNGSKVPLFMVHGGGLNVLNYVNLSKHFDEDQPFYGIQGVGAKGYEDWYDSIETMAAHYIDAIVKVNPNGPYALAGFCVGGIVAFEMTRQLKEQGKEVSLTILLDSYADSSYYYKTYKQKKLVRYVARTHRRLTFLKEMLLSWKAFKMRINAKKEYLLKMHFDQNDRMSEQDALALEQFTEAASMIQGILDRYHLKSQNIKVDLFRSKDHVDHKLAPTHLGWKKAALKGVAIHNIQADKFDIRVSPNDKILARMFQEILDEKHINFNSGVSLKQERNNTLPTFLRRVTLINFFLLESFQVDLPLYLV